MISLRGFSEDGCFVASDLIAQDVISALNSELDALFDLPSRDGYAPGSVEISPVTRAIASPVVNVTSLNLLEFAVEVFDELKLQMNEPLDTYVVTAISVFSEIGNHKPLFYHTDLRRGMYRAQIYLRGGSLGSGAFKYIRGSHRFTFAPGSHRMTDEEMQPLLYDEVIFDGGEGSTVVFDSYGFHGKDICVQERRSIMVEFQERDSLSVKGKIEFDTSHLTDRVLESVQLFRAASDPETYAAGHGSAALKNHVGMRWDQRLRYQVSRRLAK